MNTFDNMCLELGVPVAAEKTVGPSPALIFLGLEIDTVKMSIRIPQDKLGMLRDKLIYLLSRKKVTLKDLQSLTGVLNFCSRAIPAGRAFSRRFTIPWWASQYLFILFGLLSR